MPRMRHCRERPRPSRSSDVDEIVLPRGGGWDANQLAGRFGDAARTGDGWTASPTRSLIRAQNSDWGWCGDATAMPENLPGATT